MLCALAAGRDRHLIIVTGITSEGWNNTEGQCLAYAASQPVWDLLGAGSQNNMVIHLDGHAILPSDLECILDYCDVHLLGKSVKTAACDMKAGFFLKENRDRLDPAFDRYEAEYGTLTGSQADAAGAI
jgi:endo-1,4-beta-xylanase